LLSRGYLYAIGAVLYGRMHEGHDHQYVLMRFNACGYWH
jgi:hypothetical protein